MLKSHKSLHCTPSPYQSNELIFLERPKTLFLVRSDNFWSFLLNRDFSKNNRALSRISPYGLLKPYNVSEKKNNERIPKQLPERMTDGRKDRP